jgi:hypothetical protein
MSKTLRPRGFKDWTPDPESAALIANVQAILAHYRSLNLLPLTLRQIFYRLVGQYGYDKSEKAYKSLGEKLNRARRARMIPFTSIRDDGNTESSNFWYSSEAGFHRTIESAIQNFTLDQQNGQLYRIFVLCEAAGMVPMLANVADDYSIPVLSASGFDSVTAKYNLAVRFSTIEENVRVLHIGDHDPSGVHIFKNLDEDVNEFLYALVEGTSEFERIAVTEEQIAAYSLPTAPRKATDGRSFAGVGGDPDATVQAEALDPADLAAILRAAIEMTWDHDIQADVLTEQKAIRARLLGRWTTDEEDE